MPPIKAGRAAKQRRGHLHAARIAVPTTALDTPTGMFGDVGGRFYKGGVSRSDARRSVASGFGLKRAPALKICC
jgi:hypothetical protein